MSPENKPKLFSPGIGKGGMNELHYAAYCGCVDDLQQCLNAGFDPNAKDEYRGYTALHWLADMAATGGPRVEILKLLVSKGADINRVSDTDETAMSLAAAAASGCGDDLVLEFVALGAKT
jgi:ankyrin repeat protein